MYRLNDPSHSYGELPEANTLFLRFGGSFWERERSSDKLY